MNMPPQSRSDGDLSFDELRAMYDAQCACTDEWVAKYEAEKEKKASANLLNRIAELKSQLADVNRRLAAANEQLTARSENRTQLAHVWAVESKTTFALFASEDGARSYVSSFPPSVGGGMGIAKMVVLK